MAEKNKNSSSEVQLSKAQDQFDAFDKTVKDLTLDRMNTAPKEEVEPQTKLSQADLSKSKEVYLKPKRAISSKEKFNERFRDEWKFSTEFVHFIAENKELIGETIDMWTKPFPGMAAEEWDVPTNKPVWGPRHLAEKIKRSRYHRLVMQQNQITSSEGVGQFYGSMIADTTIQRLDAIPVSSRKSVFMGA